MKKDIKLVGEITARLNAFASKVEAQSFNPSVEKLMELRKEIMAYAGTSQFAIHAVRAHKEEIGTLLINILELEDNFK